MTQPERKNENTRFVVGVIIGILIGLALFGIWNSSGSEDVEGAMDDNSQTTSLEDVSKKDSMSKNTSVGGVYTLNIENQEAGAIVRIDDALVSEDSWVAIMEDVDGRPGNILGAQLFRPGFRNGAVELLRNTKPGEVYYGTLYRDDGDRVFDHKVDAPVEDATGNVILVTFHTFSE